MHTLLRFIVKKLSQYLVGCWNIHCTSTHEVYFKLGGLFYFFYQSVHVKPINLAKEHFLSSWFKCYSLQFYPPQL